MKNITIVSMESKESNSRILLLLALGHSKLTWENVNFRLSQYQTSGLYFSFNRRIAQSLAITESRILCPLGANPKNYTIVHDDDRIIQLDCDPCPKGKYFNNRGSLFFNDSMVKYDFNDKFLRFVGLKSKIMFHECQSCPIGGVCNNGLVKSRGRI